MSIIRESRHRLRYNSFLERNCDFMEREGYDEHNHDLGNDL